MHSSHAEGAEHGGPGRLSAEFLRSESEDSQEAHFVNRTTIGVMLTDNVIDCCVIGGPAYETRKLHKGDVIVAVDGKWIEASDLPAALIGNDEPGHSD
jgi:C-terminal processing protease CtpA/Prc